MSYHFCFSVSVSNSFFFKFCVFSMSLEVISGHQYLVDPIEGVGGGEDIK